jgi:hypothetical protein
MDKALRNTLRNVVTKCRKLLEEAVGELLQGQFGIHADGKVEDATGLTHLSAEDLSYREEVLAHLEHIKASGLKSKDATAQLIREAAFTHLNRLCAYKMMTSRGLIKDPVGKGLKSRGFVFYLADHPEDEELFNGAQEDVAYRHYFEWINESWSSEIGVLFAPEDIATRLFPPHRVLIRVLDLINSEDLQAIWIEDETIGWMFQYFTPKELRDQARRESAAPRNFYEMAFRNQFFTPRYVVEFLVDNTLGRTWYEMRSGESALVERCRYLAKGTDGNDIPHRSKKDPREIKVLDPACGSGHFLLYCFDVLETIYEEAYDDPELGPKLKESFPSAEGYKRAIPDLILSHNLHGIDIDLRVTQLAALALWLRAQRAFQEMGLGPEERPQIKRMSLVCAEPMPGEKDLLEEFIAQLAPHPLGKLTGDLVRSVFERMKLAGEAGALVRIEDEIRGPIEEARKQWQEIIRRKVEREEELAKKGALFDYEKEEQQKKLTFDMADITDERVWHDAESEVVNALHEYARRATNGKGLLRRLFAEDTEQGFAFIDLCRQNFDVVLMNPPFGDASIPSKTYIDETYGDTKGDVYKAFVECFQDRLVEGGFLGAISSRAGFFLSLSSDWRERVVLRLYRPLLLADFGMGVLDAMVETAAYVLRTLTSEEDRQLTLRLARDLQHVPTDKKDFFSTKKYEVTRGLKRHQATGELTRLFDAGFIKPIEGHFPRWSPVHGEIAKAPSPKEVPYPSLACFRLLGEQEKGTALKEIVHMAKDPRCFIISPEDFRQVPNTPFCYWISDSIRKLFVVLPPFESEGRTVKQGLASSDDFRFARLWWEVAMEETCPPSAHPVDQIGPYCVVGEYRWFPFAKGGSYSPYYADLHLVLHWERDGEELKSWAGSLYGGSHWSRIIKNTEYYFQAGLTYPLRTAYFSPQVMPAGSVISVRGSGIYGENLAAYLALLASKPFDFLIKILLGRDEHPQFDMGDINLTPTPSISSIELLQLSEPAINCFAIKQKLDSTSETSHVFHLPSLLQASCDTLVDRIAAWQSLVAEAKHQIAAAQEEIDDTAFRLYGISDEDRRAIESSATHKALATGDREPAEDETESDQPVTDHRPLTTDLLSYAVGCTFGRWDARFATGDLSAPELPNAFAPLPVCAPGALTGEDGLPLKEIPEGYPLRLDGDGILVDDSLHRNDLIARVRKVFELLWPTTAEAREREACELLGVKDLRDYFRKPGASGFWMDHVRRYSKSRRKAPLYWLLQSSRKNYAIWIYYHGIDKDMLYKVLVGYVEPKIRLEENNLGQLREKSDRVGTAGREAKELERERDKQESFLSELHEFYDKLKRAADLHLEPDLNDGVVLNIAPLWELVPWAEAKKYWNELLAGKYEWSSIGKQLRAMGIVS